MTTAVVIGSAACVHYDLYRLPCQPDLVVAANAGGLVPWHRRLDAWVTMHSNVLPRWIRDRADRGLTRAGRLFGSRRHPNAPASLEVVGCLMPGQVSAGSSGLFAAKVALIDMGADRVIFCGVPMTSETHFNDTVDWLFANELRAGWLETLPEWRARMTSMSGWTRDFLGEPS